MLKTTKSAENSLSSVDIAEDAKVSIGVGDNETVKKPPFKKPNGPTEYFISLCFGEKISFP